MGLPGADRSAQELNVELESIAGHRTALHRPLEEGFALYALRIEHAIASMSQPERDQATRVRDTLARMGALEIEASALEEFAGAMRAFGSIAELHGEMPAGFEKVESDFGELATQLLALADRIPQAVTAGGTVEAPIYVPVAGNCLPPAQVSRPQCARVHPGLYRVRSITSFCWRSANS
jgi:hypothetical protein